MNVLIIGTGVIGTIYGWALSEAGINVIHLVRKGKTVNDKHSMTIDILDERKGFEKYNKTVYQAKIIDDLDGDTQYDIVIVPTNWFQTQAAIESVLPYCSNSFFYILTSNWTGTTIFDAILSKKQYILGYPDAGGTIKNGNIYWTNIGPEIHIAKSTDENKDGFDKINSIFEKAHIKLDVQENMLHWLWVHNAGSIPIMVAFQKYKNIERYLADKQLLKKSFQATRECLSLCEKRGAFSKNYPEISAFKLPMWLLIPLFKFNFRHNASMQRYTAHAEKVSLDDIKCNYNDIFNTAKEYQLEMPNYHELGKFLNRERYI